MSLEEAGTRGVLVHYGTRSTNEKNGGTSSKPGQIKELSITFDYDDLPADAAYAGLAAQIPANASILSARLEILTAFTSTSTTTDLTVGITDADGGATVTDADALVLATEATQTTIGTDGNIISGAGASVGAGIAEATVITVAPSVDDLLTGRARVIVEYLPLRA